MNHIDVSSLLRQTLACDLYSNLVTRPTGAAVRGQIERMLREAQAGRPADTRERTLTVIDFSQVSMIDYSCADEIIAKLLLQYCADAPPHEAYFLFRGVSDAHWEALESVVERHGLAMVVEQDVGVRVVGVLADGERRVWEALQHLGHARADDLADALGEAPEVARRALETLWRRRLVMKLGDADDTAEGRYAVVGCRPGAERADRHTTGGSTTGGSADDGG